MGIKITVGDAAVVRHAGVSIIGRVIETDGKNVLVMTPSGNSIEVKYGLAYRPTREEKQELQGYEKREIRPYASILKENNGQWEKARPQGQDQE